jgi:hypothetical protein
MFRARLLCSVVSMVVLMSSVSYAEDKMGSNQPGVQENPQATSNETPLTVLNTATDAMMKGLDDNQLKQFAAIQNSHGTIQSVENVQLSISKAVESCAAANPDIKDDISNHFESWKDAVRPVMKKARTKLDKMILLQGFAQPSQVRAYLKKFDAAVIYRNQNITEVPITKKDDCQKLQDNMGKTQNDLVDLLTEALALNADLKVKE